MPYVKQSYRGVYAKGIKSIREAFAGVGAGDGELNYVLTSVALAWLDYHQPPHGYAMLSGVVKALECAKLEFYRRRMAPYEDEKIKENGDIYE